MNDRTRATNVTTVSAIATDRFEIVRTLGEGGFGVVYEAFDRERGLRVALKTLKRLDARARDRFRSEFRGLADLTHPNLPLFFELFTVGDEWFFTMELVEGSPLDVWVRGEAHRGPLPQSSIRTRSLNADPTHDASAPRISVDARFSEERLRSALAQLRSVLGFLHAHGHVHRDVKPSNVRVREDGHLFLLDFGLAGRVGDVSKHFLGTPAYAAPEQIHGGPATPAVDAYALGVMVFELVAGRLPFPGAGAQVLLDKQTRRAPRLRSLGLDVPDDIDALVDGWLERDPARRAPVAEGAAPAQTVEPFVGRGSELHVLREAFEAVVAGDTRVVLLEGESGMGKTSLVERALGDVRQRFLDATILVGRPSPKERVPFNAFEGVLPSRRVVDATERAAVRKTAMDTLGAYAQAGPLVIWIDDFQWADDDSRELLFTLLRPPQLRPALFILSRRPPLPDEAPFVLPCARVVVRVGPLTVGEAAALAREVGCDDARSMAVAMRSGGHPLFVRELCHATGASEDVALDDVLRDRIAALPESQRELLLLLATSDVPLAEARLAKASGRARGEVARDLELLRRARLARADPRSGVGFRTYHDRVREVAASMLEPAERRRIHEALLSTLDDESDLPARLEHLLGADRREEAARVAREAAAASAEAGAWAQAAMLLGEAIRLGCLSKEEERSVRMRRVELLEKAHRPLDAAKEAREIAEQLRDGETVDAWRMRAARLYLAAGAMAPGREVLRGIFERIGLRRIPVGPLQTLASIAYDRALARRELRRMPPLPEHQRTERERRAAGEYALLRTCADGFSMTDHALAYAFQSRALRAAIASRDPMLLAEAMLIDALYVGSKDAKDRVKAERAISEAFALFAPGEVPLRARAWATVIRATLEKHERPSLAIAERLAVAEQEFLAAGGDSWILGSVRLVWGHDLRICGDLPKLRAHARRIVDDAEARNDLFVATTAHLGSLLIWLADDAPLAARQIVSQVSWPSERSTMQHWLSLEATVEISLYEGNGATLLEELGPGVDFLRFALLKRLQSTRICCNFTLGRALVAALEGGRGGRRARVELELVVRRLRREKAGYADVRASLLAAGLHAVRGDRARAVASLAAAERIGREAGLVLDPLVAAWLRSHVEDGPETSARRDAAERALLDLGVRVPRRFVRVVAPGFERWLPPEPSVRR